MIEDDEDLLELPADAGYEVDQSCDFGEVEEASSEDALKVEVNF
jgi:hypothetical protein